MTVDISKIEPGQFVLFPRGTSCLEIVSVTRTRNQSGTSTIVAAKDMEGLPHNITGERWEREPPTVVDLKRVRDWNNPALIDRVEKAIGAPLETVSRDDLEGIICRLLSGGAL